MSSHITTTDSPALPASARCGVHGLLTAPTRRCTACDAESGHIPRCSLCDAPAIVGIEYETRDTSDNRARAAHHHAFRCAEHDVVEARDVWESVRVLAEARV